MASIRQSVIGYGRVSTEEQESNYSLDAQRSRFENLCKQNRWQSLGFFPETGSGTSVLRRPVLCNILQRIEQGGVDALSVKETDRLSRPENLGDLSLISQTLEGHSTLLIVDSRTLDLREDNSVLMLDFEGVMAKHFRRQLLRNMNRGKVRKAELGRKAGGADIFGYRTNDNGEYEPDLEEAKSVQLIYSLYTTKDLRLRHVKAELKKRGITTRRGCEWSISMLGVVLRNDIYLGVYRFHKSKHGKDVDGSRYRVNRQDQIVIGTREKPNHPPLIEPWMFEAAEQKLNANRKRNSVRLHMATGLLRCPTCSAHMHIKYSSAPGYRVHRGRIEKYTCSRKPQCTSKRIAVAETNDTLWNALVQLLIKPGRIHSMIAPAPENDTETLKKDLASVEREDKATREKQQRLLDLYLEGNIPQASYVVKSSELETELERLSQRKMELGKRMAGKGQRDLTTELIQTLRILARSHRRLTSEQKTAVFRSIVKEARLTAGGVELEVYVQPIQNSWFKYRQKQTKQHSTGIQTIRIHADRATAVLT